MRSRRSGSGWPSGDTRVSGRRVTCKAPSAHVEGGSGRSEASPTAILQDTHSVEGYSEKPVCRMPHSSARWPPYGRPEISRLIKVDHYMLDVRIKMRLGA
jgi:hypothetical protein